MASLDELVQEIQGVVDQIEQTVNSVGGVENSAEKLQNQFSGLGVEDKAQHMSQVKGRLGDPDAFMSQVKDVLDEWSAEDAAAE